jgi:hypothetical protein
MARGVLIAAMDFTGLGEDEFHDLYDREHVLERQRAPGFTADRRSPPCAAHCTPAATAYQRMRFGFREPASSPGLRGKMGDFGDHFPGEKPH